PAPSARWSSGKPGGGPPRIENPLLCSSVAALNVRPPGSMPVVSKKIWWHLLRSSGFASRGRPSRIAGSSAPRHACATPAESQPKPTHVFSQPSPSLSASRAIISVVEGAAATSAGRPGTAPRGRAPRREPAEADPRLQPAQPLALREPRDHIRRRVAQRNEAPRRILDAAELHPVPQDERPHVVGREQYVPVAVAQHSGTLPPLERLHQTGGRLHDDGRAVRVR